MPLFLYIISFLSFPNSNSNSDSNSNHFREKEKEAEEEEEEEKPANRNAVKAGEIIFVPDSVRYYHNLIVEINK